MQLTENELKYLKLVAEARKENDWCPPETARQFLDKEKLREAGIDKKYVKNPAKFDYSNDVSGNKSIEEKVGELPECIEKLIRYVELLHEAGYLDVETWGPHWSKLLNSEEWDDEEFELSDRMYTSETPQEELGREFGITIRRLALLPKMADDEEFMVGLLSGVIEAFTSEMGSGRAIGLVEELHQRLEDDIRLTRISDRLIEMTDYDFLGDIEDEIDACIEENLSQMGIDPSDELVKSVKLAIQDEYENGKGLAVMIAGDGSPTAGDWDVEKYVTQERVRRVVEGRDLHEKIQLKQKLRADLNELFSISCREVVAPEVIINTPEEGGSVRDVAEEISESADDKVAGVLPAVVNLSRYLDGEKDSNLGERDGIKVLSLREEGDMSDWELELTPYGEIIKENIDTEIIDRNRGGFVELWNVHLSFIEVPDELLTSTLRELPQEDE